VTFKNFAFSIARVAQKIIKTWLAKIAVLVILAIASLVAWELSWRRAINDAKIAQESVYYSPLSFVILLSFRSQSQLR